MLMEKEEKRIKKKQQQRLKLNVLKLGHFELR